MAGHAIVLWWLLWWIASWHKKLLISLCSNNLTTEWSDLCEQKWSILSCVYLQYMYVYESYIASQNRSLSKYNENINLPWLVSAIFVVGPRIGPTTVCLVWTITLSNIACAVFMSQCWPGKHISGLTVLMLLTSKVTNKTCSKLVAVTDTA